MEIALALYDRFTALDIVGPFQVFVDVPGVDTYFVAERTGPVTDHTGRLALVATRTFADVEAPDVVVVPGGFADATADADHPVVRWLRRVHPRTTWTTSVCTGSIFLALAGILDGTDATSHWTAYERLEALGARPTAERVVERGRVVTGAGVSAGIDMALTLVGRVFGDEIARTVQLAIEYDPQPPYDSGSPAKASPETVALLRELVTTT
jgi:transcriptional regulator GlxA family with amidase domain